MKHIAISIEYAGLTLPVVKNEQGTEVVPLKPIAELFGLEWVRQHKRLQEDWTAEFLGVCVVHMYYAGDQKRQMVCVRLDRVAAYLMSLNPAKIRAAGNESGAAFLQAKLTEWADALHDYETFGSAHNPRHADALLALRRANAIANVAKIRDADLRKLALAELGIDLAASTPAAADAHPDLFAGE
ncbi:phage antirepressor N-terminal domain-containing protein [Thauera butanivorans]|uniref:phage antirepressor N-terminal domain-containing protein n=1 Tax=Thauera butanivorans TaxID=86174 RepID=UPI000839A3B4|nr:phage antirepressor N-terminal domain-containing protein [Thauera butanivorans]